MYAQNFLENVKKRCGLLLAIACYIGFAWIVYDASIPAIIDLVESRSIIYFFWPCFIGMLFIPAICYFVFVFSFVFFTKTLQAPKVLAKGITIAYHYFGVVFIIGNLISFIVVFYPLGTHYVLCERSGPFSGTYYTRTEEICEQVIYLRKNKPPEAIQELKDELDSVEPH
ncbi:hypothetical protein GTGU_03163 [Trabulsiella guamensis ATCC 49490]|uniref:DUF1240 domain-containing protein n=1 Tax=Trabulsiella guamensis ATCC 49490 TaxID=1005994 RepID=A0A085A2J6_9ENTR|nr:DUF1240 domain-containing protein [Trabulsiella guamensis]KFC04441.1 hypothetical protein GTGU_03163 [Trabulsiella guamensis ATCC 49490]